MGDKKCRKYAKAKYNQLSIILIIIIFIFIVLHNSIIIKNGYDDEVKPSKENIYFEEKFDSFQDAFNKAKDFLDKCIKGLLIRKKTIKPISKPKISVVIPCYNCKDYILRALRSIQNQDYDNLEIIINNDFSSDDTLSYLKQLKNEDPRIIIINIVFF